LYSRLRPSLEVLSTKGCSTELFGTMALQVLLFNDTLFCTVGGASRNPTNQQLPNSKLTAFK
jgi:hypothetical protein